jgi:hypothetical protein
MEVTMRRESSFKPRLHDVRLRPPTSIEKPDAGRCGALGPRLPVAVDVDGW